MSSGLEPINADVLIQLGELDRTRRLVAEWVTQRMNEHAGPYGLSPREQWQQTVCRQKFGFYDPLSRKQWDYLLTCRGGGG